VLLLVMLTCTKPCTEEKVCNTLIKVCLYKTIMIPVVTYGPKSWTLTNTMESALMMWEGKILIKVYGPTFGNSLEKLNQDVWNKLHPPDFVTLIKLCELEWLGHVVRMVGEGTVKNLLEGKTGGQRKEEDLD
jgi:hypothetical protein